MNRRQAFRRAVLGKRSGGLILYSPLDAPSSATSQRDVSALGQTVTNAGGYSPGLLHNGWRGTKWDGVTGSKTYLPEVSNAVQVAGEASFTALCWVRYTATGLLRLMGRSQVVLALLNYRSDTSTVAAGYVSLYSRTGVDANALASSALNLNDGRPHLLCFIRDSTTTMRIGMDGMFDTSRVPAGVTTHNTTSFTIGWDETGAQYFSGMASDWIMLDRPISSMEFRELYLTGMGRLAHPRSRRG